MDNSSFKGYDLSEINEELEAQKEELTAAIEELESQNKRLVETVGLLESRNSELDQLIYRTNHDLKGPITSIEGINNILKADLDGTKYIDLTDHIDKNVSLFKDILNSIGNLSMNIRRDVIPSEINFVDIFENIIREFGLENDENAPKLSMKCQTGRCLISDEERIDEIIRAVLTNALDFRIPDKKSLINIKVGPFKEGCLITIIDNGVGMDGTVLKRATEMFYRGSEDSKGAGLGLYITKRMVELLKGELNIRSRNGFGTTVEIYVPSIQSLENK